MNVCNASAPVFSAMAVSSAVLAPRAKLRSQIVPQPIRDNQQLNPDSANSQEANYQEPLEHGRPLRLGWARLLIRVFDRDLTHGPHCGGDLRIIAAILKRDAIEKILNHLGLEPRPPPVAPARGQMAL